jgi:pimeloyl-ACP methyl ester carboxylesterase
MTPPPPTSEHFPRHVVPVRSVPDPQDFAAVIRTRSETAARDDIATAVVDRERFSYAFMDCRGYGDSRDVDGQHTMAEWALDAVTLADELGWSRFSLLGHSMGGMAVQRVLLEDP